MESVSVWHGETPPSVNSSSGFGSSNWQKRWREKSEWEGLLGMLFLQAKLPRNLERIEIAVKLRFPSKRKRDAGNYGPFLDKCMGDALQKGGWISDDTPDVYEFLGVEFEDDTGPKRTTVVLAYRLK